MAALRPFPALLLSAALLAMAGGAHAAESGKDKAGGKEGASFVPIDTLVAQVRAANGRREVMTVQSGVDAPDPAVRERARLSQPRLRDAYTQALQLYAAALSPGAPPDADALVRKLQAATDQVLGRPGGRLLLGGIMIN